jgi:hypothetical protein
MSNILYNVSDLTINYNNNSLQSNNEITHVSMNSTMQNYGYYSSLSSGNPYIIPMEGNTIYKLPSKVRTYRLFESENIIINASVAPIKTNYVKRITDIFLNNNIFKTNKYYYDKFYISISRNHINNDVVCSKNNYFIFDEAINLLEINNDDLIVIYKDNNLYTNNVNGISSKYYTTTITFDDEQCGNVVINLNKYLNPQIINGIECTISNNILNELKGVLIRQNNCKNYEVNNIKYMKPIIMKYNYSNKNHMNKESYYSKI